MAAQAAIKARAGDIRAEELTRDGQQIIQRQQQGPAQIDNNGLLFRRQAGLQPMGGVGAIRGVLAMFPFVHRAFADAIAFGQDTRTVRARGNLGANQRCCPGVLV